MRNPASVTWLTFSQIQQMAMVFLAPSCHKYLTRLKFLPLKRMHLKGKLLIIRGYIFSTKKIPVKPDIRIENLPQLGATSEGSPAHLKLAAHVNCTLPMYLHAQYVHSIFCWLYTWHEFPTLFFLLLFGYTYVCTFWKQKLLGWIWLASDYQWETN